MTVKIFRIQLEMKPSERDEQLLAA